ncbi:transmembrane protein 154 [Hyperolius riggenbachi]|uniref:transmembrane protein 154 n=1 Tax=Hyperolius riggenbachi TaxID=752182 RepID=UPI0035A3B99B
MRKFTINCKETGNVEVPLSNSCRIIKVRAEEDQRAGSKSDMQVNICNICCLPKLLLFVGLFHHGITEDAEYDADLQSTYVTPLDGTDDHSVLNTEQTLFTTSYENTNDTEFNSTDPTEIPPSDVITLLICATPAIVLVLLIPLIIFLVRRKRRKKHKEVADDEPQDEDIKSPIFEEDTPSVMEIEMEDLDKWMSNMKKHSNRLSTLEEENKFRTSIDS